MHAPAGAILSCSYCPEQEGFFDVENVLIYNVGTGTFAASSRNGLSFERRRIAPSAAPDGRTYGHLCEYRFVPTPSAPNPEDGAIAFVPGRLSEPFDVWWAATTVGAVARQALVAAAFGLQIDLRLPVLPKNPGAIVKRLVDGIVASLHSDESPDVAAVERLAARHGLVAEDILARLRLPPNAWLPLGVGARLVRPYRDGVQWFPADELCEQCTLTVAQAAAPACVFAVTSLRPLTGQSVWSDKSDRSRA